jgi:hypothetical protein
MADVLLIGCPNALLLAGKNKSGNVKSGDQPWDDRRRKQTFSH